MMTLTPLGIPVQEEFVKMALAKTIISYLENIKPVSPYFQEIINSLNAKTSVLDLGRKVSLDPAISAKLIQVCSSPRFGIQKPIQSPIHAVALLGMERAREVIITSQIKDALCKTSFSSYEYDLWEHSLAIAYGMQALIRRLGLGLSLGESFTTGLLHDLGKIILLNIFKDNHVLASHLVKGGMSAISVERKLIGCDHVEVISLLLKKWDIPSHMINAIIGHHDLTFNDPMTKLIHWAHYVVYGKDYSAPPATETQLLLIRDDVVRDLELVELFYL